MDKITIAFLNELFLLCFNKKEIIEIVTTHLQYQFIPDEFSSYKKILKAIINIWKTTQRLPTIGVISQQYEKDLKVHEALAEIKEAQFADKDMILQT